MAIWIQFTNNVTYMIRIQSAMEYLMTYGWAILAIAIVMVSLYSLGIFNSGNLQPTATPGSCEVVRTTAQTSLAGQCSNLIPKYVGQFNGASSYVDLGDSSSLETNSYTWSLWFNPTTWDGGNAGVIAQGNYQGSPYVIEQGTSSNPYLSPSINGGAGGYTVSATVAVNTWSHVVITYDYAAGSLSIYINGKVVQTATGSALTRYVDSILVGEFTYSNGGYYTGLASNVQIYNTSLDNASVRALYQEGIGGTPIDIQHLVGWWPLNGNANDYSGNNNQGTPTNVIWSANWQSGYTAPAT